MSVAGDIAAAIVIATGLIAIGLVAFSAWTAQQVEKRLPPRGHFVAIDGNRIHYVDEGTGPALLLVHGLAGQMHNFTHSLVERLKRDHRVVVFDRPGNGYSTRAPHASAAIGAQARVISRFCDAIGLEKPLLVGHSLGGAIALAVALDHPEQIAGVALTAPVTQLPGRPPPPFDGLAIASPLLRHIVAWTLATPLSILNRNRTRSILFGPQAVAADFAIKGGGLLNLRPCSFIGASCDLMAASADLETMPARYQDLAVPVGILYGTGDRILDPALHGQLFATQAPGVDLELIEGGGHMILIASADQTAAFVARMARRAADIGTGAPLAPVI
jgi:pimeloyl-ACP methyl ester carboxylesterase